VNVEHVGERMQVLEWFLNGRREEWLRDESAVKKASLRK
jgi:hypothetical protein